jgi:hypothetical protein
MPKKSNSTAPATQQDVKMLMDYMVKTNLNVDQLRADCAEWKDEVIDSLDQRIKESERGIKFHVDMYMEQRFSDMEDSQRERFLVFDDRLTRVEQKVGIRR